MILSSVSSLFIFGFLLSKWVVTILFRKVFNLSLITIISLSLISLIFSSVVLSMNYLPFYLSAALFILSFFIVSLNMKSLGKNIIFFILTYTLSFLTAYITYNFIAPIVFQDDKVSIIFILIALNTLIAFNLSLFVLRLNQKFQFFSLSIDVSSKQKKVTLIFFIAWIVCSILLLLFASHAVLVNSLSDFLFFLNIIFGFSILYLYARMNLKNQELNSLNVIYKKELQKIQLTQELKHDFSGLLFSLSYQIMEKNNDAALEMINNLSSYMNTQLHSYFDSKLLRLQSPELLGLLITHFKKWETESIILKLEEIDELVVLPAMPTFDLVRCLNIILDNAFEAASTSTEKKINVRIKVESTYLLFEIKNSFAKNIDLESLSTRKRFSTKGNGRGQGLHILQEFIRREKDAYFEMEVTPQNMFRVLLTLPLQNKNV
ncbi:GHKL domain-containing protein [Listeria aquatica]|nr:GHKL domain-containing protein [Listeria aquatica]